MTDMLAAAWLGIVYGSASAVLIIGVSLAVVLRWGSAAEAARIRAALRGKRP